MIKTDKTYGNKPIAYEVLDDGYMIYLDGKAWVKQCDPYGKPMDASKTYEENAKLQIDEFVIDDYVSAIVAGKMIIDDVPKEYREEVKAKLPSEPVSDIDQVLTELETEVGINEQ